MSKPYVIGIDMGGTNTVFGIVDARGTVIASNSIKTAKHSDINDYIDELYQEINRLIVANDAVDKIHGIGIGAPNANYFTGRIEGGVNLPWPSPIPLADLLSAKFGIPVAITNDANAAAIGEMTYGVARGLKDFIMITLGIVVGAYRPFPLWAVRAKAWCKGCCRARLGAGQPRGFRASYSYRATVRCRRQSGSALPEEAPAG